MIFNLRLYVLSIQTKYDIFIADCSRSKDIKVWACEILEFPD